MPTAADYKQALIQLLPPGKLWRSLAREGTRFGDLLEALSQEYARVDDRAADLMKERDPRQADELLEEWEALVGLPDPCVTGAQTKSERQAAVHARLTTPLGMHEDFFIEVAANLGYTITIDSRALRLYGRAKYGEAYGDSAWRFVWIVQVDGSGPADDLECLFERIKPAHTVVQFEYS